MPDIFELDRRTFPFDGYVPAAYRTDIPYTERWSNYANNNEESKRLFRLRYVGRGNIFGTSVWKNDRYNQYNYPMPTILSAVNPFEPSPYNNALELRNAKPGTTTHDQIYVQPVIAYMEACMMAVDLNFASGVESGLNTDIDCYAGFEINSGGADKSLYCVRFYHDGTNLKAELRAIYLDDERYIDNGLYTIGTSKEITSLFDFTKWNRLQLALGKHTLHAKAKPAGGSYVQDSLTFSGYRTSVVGFLANETGGNSIYTMKAGTWMQAKYNGAILAYYNNSGSIGASGTFNVTVGNGYEGVVAIMSNLDVGSHSTTIEADVAGTLSDSNGTGKVIDSNTASIAQNKYNVLAVGKDAGEYITFKFKNNDASAHNYKLAIYERA